MARVGLVDVGVRGEPGVVLADPAHVPERGGAVVAGAGVDAGEVDHASRAYGRAGDAPYRCRRADDYRRGRFRVVGGARLAGEVRVTGAKNSVLKLMAAALLAEGAPR